MSHTDWPLKTGIDIVQALALDLIAQSAMYRCDNHQVSDTHHSDNTGNHQSGELRSILVCHTIGADRVGPSNLCVHRDLPLR